MPETGLRAVVAMALAATEAKIREAGGTAAYAETSGRPQYAPTRGFYTRCGYDTAAVFDDFYAPGDANFRDVTDPRPWATVFDRAEKAKAAGR